MLIDFIDLSSDDETAQKDQIATQHRAMLLDSQTRLVVAGEGSKGVQTVFVAASEGRQEAVECGHALEATTSFLFTEKAPLLASSEGSQDVQAFIDLSSDDETAQEDQIATQHQAMLLDSQTRLVVAGEGSKGLQAVFVAASEGRQEAVECRHALEATTSFLFTEKAPLLASSEGSQDVQAVFVAASEGNEDVQAVFVAAGEGSQDVQAVIVAASEGRQEAAECGHALEATTSFLVMETAPLVAGSEGSQDMQAVFVAASEGGEDEQAPFVAASEGSQDVQAVLVAASEGRQEAAECGHALEATTSFLVTEKAPLVAASEGGQDMQAVFIAASEGGGDEHAAFVAASEGSQDVQTVLVAASEGRQDAADSGNALEATTSSLVTGKTPLDMAESQNRSHSPTSASFPSPTSTTPKALTSKGGDAKLARRKVKHPRKNHYTGTPRTSPRFDTKPECCNGPVEELPAEALTPEGGDADLVRGKVQHPVKDYHTRTPGTSPRFEPNRECHNRPVEELPAEALTSKDGVAKLVRGRVKHPRMNYHTNTPRVSPRFEPKLECHNGHVDELSAEALTSEGGDEELVRGKVKHHRKNYHTGTPRTSPKFEQKLDCRNGSLEEPPAEALTSEGGDAELVRGKVQYPGKDYRTGTPGTSPRFEPKLECHNGHVEELQAKALTSEGGDSDLVRGKVKHPRKSYHTGTPRTSPRFERKLDCRNGPVEELPAEILTSEGGHGELVRGMVQHPGKDYHTGTPRTSPRFKLKRECHNEPVDELPAEALTSEGGDEKLVRGKVKHHRKDYHTSTPRTSPRFEQKLDCSNGPVEELPSEVLTSEVGCVEVVRGKVQHPGNEYHTGTLGTSLGSKPKRECHNGPVDELPAKALTSERGDEKLVRGKVKQRRKDYHTSTPRTSPRFEQKLDCSNGPVEELPAEALTSEGGCVELVTGKVQHPGKEYHTGTPGTSLRSKPKHECHNGPVDELPAKALTSEGGDEKLVRGKVNHPGKDYHIGTPRISPRFKLKRECHNGPVDKLPAEALTSEGGDGKLVRGKVKQRRKDYHTSTPRTSPRFEHKLDCSNGPVEELPAEALTSEGGCVELVSGKVQHPGKEYHTGTPGTSLGSKPKPECHNGPVDELPAKALTSEGGDEKLVRGKVKHPKKNYHTGTPRTSPRFEQKLDCRNGPVEELPAEALTSEGADAELARGKVKHPRMDYHTGTPRTSPRFVPKRDRRDGPVEELAADYKRFRTLEELITSLDSAESVKTTCTGSAY